VKHCFGASLCCSFETYQPSTRQLAQSHTHSSLWHCKIWDLYHVMHHSKVGMECEQLTSSHLPALLYARFPTLPNIRAGLPNAPRLTDHWDNVPLHLPDCRPTNDTNPTKCTTSHRSLGQCMSDIPFANGCGMVVAQGNMPTCIQPSDLSCE